MPKEMETEYSIPLAEQVINDNFRNEGRGWGRRWRAESDCG